MRRIWLINHYASDQGRHAFFASEMSKRGQQVYLFASSFLHYIYKESRSYSFGQFMLREIAAPGFDRIWIKTTFYRGNDLRRMLNQLVFALNVVRCGFRLRREKPDVVVGSSVHLFTGFAAYILARGFKVPFVFEVRDLWPQTLIDLGVLSERGFLTIILQGLEKFLYRSASRIVCLLPTGVEYIAAQGVERSKVIYIPNGIDLEWYDRNIESRAGGTEKAPFRDFFQEQQGKFVYTYTGAMGIANGLDNLIKAVALLREQSPRLFQKIYFMLVGDGPEKQKLMKMVDELGLVNVTFFDYINKNLIPYILDHSMACITIVKKSRVHQFGMSMNKTFDYLASGLPLISVVGAPKDTATEADCGITVEPDDPDALCGALIRMAMMPAEERRRLGENGRAYVEKNHDYKALTTALLAVIDSAVSDNMPENPEAGKGL